MNDSTAAKTSPFNWRDACIPAAIFMAVLYLFLISPVSNIGDSSFSMLLSETLLTKGSFMLDDYAPQPGRKFGPRDTHVDRKDYQIEVIGGHYYYYFPPGTSILSAPFVLIGDCFGHSVIRANKTYSFPREESAQRVIASVLMAFLAVTFYFTSRLLLTTGWSACVALGGVLGTQVWSTASRAMWTHTWGIALLGFVVYLLLAQETGRRKLNPILLASVLSWSYFVRPTNSIFIIGITVYLLLFYRSLFVRYALTGAAWFVGFVVYSWTHFHHLLPAYYQANRLELTTFREALTGNLFSPSRGLLLYVPVTLFVGYLLTRHWRNRLHPRLVWLTLAVSLGHLLAVSCFVPWYGGWCFGPRYTTELVPWLALLAVIGLRTALDWRAGPGGQNRHFAWRSTLAAGGVFLLLSVAINARGANSVVTARWNQLPVSVDVFPARVWDWRQPQMLAGLVRFPPPAVFPSVDGRRIPFGNEAGRAFQLDGWSSSDEGACWTEGHQATLIFATSDPAAKTLRLGFAPYLYGKTVRQRVIVNLNGRQLAALVANEIGEHDYTFVLPQGLLRPKNTLTFELPDAVAPKSVGEGNDVRTLGIALCWMELGDVPTAGTPVDHP